MLRRTVLPLLPLSALAGLAQQSDSDILRTLRKGHPRLLLDAYALDRTRELLESDERAQALLARLRTHGEELLTEEPVKYEIVGPRLLTQSRRCVERVYAFSALYLLRPEKRWLEGLRANIRSAANFPDWNPSHFLDVAEMTHAFAIAYDWLQDALSPDDRRVIREAIIEKGLRAANRAAYQAGPNGSLDSWATRKNNWNQVCNGGMILGALAIADEEPTLAAQILRDALQSLPTAMHEFAPDGGWYEGVGYWAYTLRYTVPLLAALDSALGNRFGIDEFPGFNQTGDFYLHGVAPSGAYFNFADCNRSTARGFPWLHWMARRFGRPAWHWAAANGATGEHPLSLLWYEPGIGNPAALRTPRDTVFLGMNAAMMRSSWEDSNASYVGFYAGHNGTNHSQLEMGTFVFEAMGERWVEELGVDDYNLPGYFGSKRWDYYRLNSSGQNVMLFNGAQQAVPARGRITSSGAENGSVHAIAELTEAYAPLATKVRRGVRLLQNRRVLLVQDEFDLTERATYQWQIHTLAEVKTDIDRARLILGDKMVEIRALSRIPMDYVLEPARPATLQTGEGKTENDNSQYRKLVIRSRDKVKQGTVGVVLQPLENPNAPRGAGFVKPLDSWD